jgi:trehalose/maltose hydrolase-like predicted phosphorylase
MNYTSNGSSLSRVVHSWVLSRSDRQHAWTLFEEALKSDIFDIQGGTTSEGIHLGAMAGTVDIVLRCFTGLHIKDDVIWFSPLLPQVIKGAELSLCYRGHWLSLKLDHRHLTIKVERSWESKGKLGFKGDVYEFEEGSVFNFSLEDNHRQTQLS